MHRYCCGALVAVNIAIMVEAKRRLRQFGPSEGIMGEVLNRLYQIIAEPTSKEMGADRPATSKTGANRQGNVHEYFIYFSMAKCCISGFCRTSVCI